MSKRFANSGTWIDDVTGEKYHSKMGGKFYDDEDLFYAQERREKEKQKQYRYTQTDELGKYILLRVKKLPTNLDPATLARLTLLSTYIDYKNRLMINKHTVMEKSDLPRILNISERAARDFVSEVKNKYLIFRDGEMFLSKEYYRGESDKYKKDAKQKLFIQTTQDLYYMLMVGIVKTLKDEGMLSDVQLNSAILKIESQKTCSSKKIAV